MCAAGRKLRPLDGFGRAAGKARTMDLMAHEVEITDAPPLGDLYAKYLSAEDRKVYDIASPKSDLAGEMRLIRTLIVRLLQKGLIEREVALRLAVAVLFRLVQVQKGGPEDETELRKEIFDVADLLTKQDQAAMDGEDPE
jgi:hypothetical protein